MDDKLIDILYAQFPKTYQNKPVISCKDSLFPVIYGISWAFEDRLGGIAKDEQAMYAPTKIAYHLGRIKVYCSFFTPETLELVSDLGLKGEL